MTWLLSRWRLGRQAEAPATLWSYTPIFLVALLGVLASWLVSARIGELEHQRRFASFSEAARDRLLVVQRELDYALGLVQDLGGFFDAASRLIGHRRGDICGYIATHVGHPPPPEPARGRARA